MIDFPIDDLLDNDACTQWLEQQLHPDGLCCPVCGTGERRVARRGRAFVGYRCRACDHYYTLLTGTSFAKTLQAPATLVVLLRGVAKGESTARLARELKLSRKQAHVLRQRVQRNLDERQPNHVLNEGVFEADELASPDDCSLALKRFADFGHSLEGERTISLGCCPMACETVVSEGCPSSGTSILPRTRALEEGFCRLDRGFFSDLQ